MRKTFDKQLQQLNNELIQMGNLIGKAIEMSVTALLKQDTELAQQVIDFDTEIDHQEQTIEGLCMKLLISQQPVARDLRLISAALKMVTDMERIGDHASDIGEITVAMAGIPYIKNLEHIQSMARETTVMVLKSLEAFVEKDAEKAREVIRQDDVVDDLFVTVKQELIQLIHQDPNNGEQATDLLMIAKYFERIGDHATNIAEWAIYSISGEKS